MRCRGAAQAGRAGAGRQGHRQAVIDGTGAPGYADLKEEGSEDRHMKLRGPDPGTRSPKAQAPRSRPRADAKAIRQLEAVINTALAHLSLDHLLDELLVRVRTLLGADTAAILLLEGDELVTRAVKGLGEERRIRTRVGGGFAGRVAAEKRPIFVENVEDVDPAHVLHPVLVEEGIRSLLGVPILFEGQVIGVLHVGTRERRQFDRGDAQLLQVVADRIGGDAQRLQQVAWNLLSNAINFTPENGRVELRLRPAGTHLELTVRDTGKGISPAFLPHVFERFRQGDASSRGTHGGLGLGLAIVRHIVELHGGTVHAESPGEGQGAVFTVALPLAVAQTAGEVERRPPKRSAPASQHGSAPLDGLRVLVVDDEPDNNEVVGTLLSSCGAEVRLAGSARQAVEMLREWKPDVLVTDIAMPDQDGCDLLATIRSQEGEPAEILAVALTAYASKEDRIRLLSAGFQAHVVKPVDATELTAVVESLGRTAQRLRAQAGRPVVARAPTPGGRPARVA